MRAAGLAFFVLALPALASPSYQEVRLQTRSSEGTLLDRNGEVLHVQRLDPKLRRLDWIPLRDVSPALREAVIASEDKQFFSHGGVDWAALGAAMVKNVTSARTRGASTLTMQVAALLEPSRLGLGGNRSLRQKWEQVLAARDLESAWSKDQILETYLNLSTFRGELQGVEAAAQGLFRKSAATLDWSESMLLAVLLRGPNANAAAIGRRACALRGSLSTVALDPSLPDCERLQRLARGLPPAAALAAIGPQDAPHLATRLLKEPGTRVLTTLRGDLQRFARDAMERRLRDLEGRGVADAAALVLDNATGEVLAYVGSSGGLSTAAKVDGVLAQRQAGSALKPFLYGLAFEQGWLTPASLLDDAPLDLVTDGGAYLPQNYDHSYRGWVSARTALAGSLNIPAVRTLLLASPEAFLERLRALGFESLQDDAEHYGYALALGGADVSLLALTNAYRALANGGRHSSTRLAPGETQWIPVQAQGASFLVSDILADAAARATTFGLASPLTTRVWTAVKTGTSKDMRDNWCVGYSSRYTVGVWVGNFSGAPMRDVSGVSGAAPLWRDLIDFLHRQEESAAPIAPEGLVRTEVRFADGIESERGEWFLAGSEMSWVAPAETEASAPRIVYPPAGMVLAMDPGIPRERQRVALLARPARKDLHWRIDGASVGEGARVLWEPQPGRHQLRLEWGDGESRQLEFVVKGGAALR